MNIGKYQEQARTTCMPSSNNVAYMLLNLIGEVGEVCEKILKHTGTDYNIIHKKLMATEAIGALCGAMAKQIRKQPDCSYKQMVEELDKAIANISNDDLTEIQKELGDIAWQWSGLHDVLGLSTEVTLKQNLDKLASRKQRNKIDGDGDNR